MNIARHLLASALRSPDDIAIIDAGRTLTYRAFAAHSAAIAAALIERGCRPGDRIALQSANCLEVLPIMFACFRAGLIVVPIHFKLQPQEVDPILADCTPRVFFTDKASAGFGTETVEIAESGFGAFWGHAGSATMAEVAKDDPAWIFYTSGTTGRSKGATLTHGNRDALIMGLLCDIDPAVAGDVFLHAGPLSHASGLCSLAHVARGTRHVILEAGTFSPDRVLDAIQAQGVTTSFFVPTMINRLLDAAQARPDAIRSLKTVIYGGAPMPVAVLEKALAIFGPVFVQLYGQGEAPHVLTVLGKSEHRLATAAQERDRDRLGSAGRPCIGAEVRILAEDGRFLGPGDVGEVVARGPIVMTGYWANPEASHAALAEGWLHTGDVGYLDAQGYLFLTDRKKELIISGGMNVYSREVEDVLHQHPAVQEAAVIGEPHPDWGEAVKAVVVLRPGQSSSADDLIAFCRDRLAPYKKPKIIVFTDELPKGATGKILKRALKTTRKIEGVA